MKFAQLFKARFFLAAALAAWVGAGFSVRPVLAASAITVYKTPT